MSKTATCYRTLASVLGLVAQAREQLGNIDPGVNAGVDEAVVLLRKAVRVANELLEAA